MVTLSIIFLFSLSHIGLFDFSLAHTGDEVPGRQLNSGEPRNAVELIPQKEFGDESCPCLTLDTLNTMVIVDNEAISKAYSKFGPAFNISTYGVGRCAPHDIDLEHCSGHSDCSRIQPVPYDCEQSVCSRSWCFVDPNNCTLSSARSMDFPRSNLYYSYATCGFTDPFTYKERTEVLKSRTFKVGYNSNTGGWRGAYNPDGHYALNNQWTGGMVNFVELASLMGEFQISMTAPPSWLRNASLQFFGESEFDFCIYATALGYLDFCVSMYTITDERAAVTPFFEMGTQPIYLIAFDSENKDGSDYFVESFSKVFHPFSLGTWIILLLAIPILGILIMYHEYGASGGAFPRSEEVIVAKTAEKEEHTETRRVPLWGSVSRTIYMSFLGCFEGGWGSQIVTRGGKCTLLAIAILFMVMSAIYTANLAAIFATSVITQDVDSIDDAINQGYNFCMTRNTLKLLRKQYGPLPDNYIVPDPVDLGGDGKAGFDCPNCKSRTRIFEMMRRSNNDRSIYCDAAIGELDDLRAFQQEGAHCDKQHVGDLLAVERYGMPIFDREADSLMTHFAQVKNTGFLEQSARDVPSNCENSSNDDDDLPVSPDDLIGLWVIVAALVTIGCMIKPIRICIQRRRNITVRSLTKHSQWGEPIEAAEEHEELIAHKENKNEQVRSETPAKNVEDSEGIVVLEEKKDEHETLGLWCAGPNV